MRVLSLAAGTTLKLYSSIMELPTGRHAEYQHWLVRGAGIGAGAGAIERHFAQVSSLLAANRQQEAGDALALLHYAFADTLDRLSPADLAFGCLVAEFDGQPCHDFTEEGLRRLLAALSAAGLTVGLVAQELEQVKKNSRPS
jgi:hypothetical protein